MNAFEKQVGGNHYKDMPIQVTEFCQRNELNHIESSIIKYACRHRKKGKRADVEKIIHYAELLLDLEYPEDDGEIAREQSHADQMRKYGFSTCAGWGVDCTPVLSPSYCYSCGKDAHGNLYCADCEAMRCEP